MSRIARCRVNGLLAAMLTGVSLMFVAPAMGADDRPRLPVPKPEALRAAEKQIREIFAADFTAAKKPAEKAALAGKLLKHADDSAEDAVARYALLETARALAVEADENKLAFNVIDSLATQFEVSELELKTSAIVANGKTARETAAQVEFCNLIQSTIDSAASDEQFEVATKLVLQLSAASAKIKDAARRKPFLTRYAELKHLQSQWTAVEKARDTLAKTPDDEAAHATYGRYLCLSAGDWEKGLPHLAKGTDAKLTTLAKQDLNQRTSPEEQLALADAWWALAQSESGVEKQNVLLRASEWYETVADSLKGLSRTKADQRIESIAKQYPEAVQVQALKRSRRNGTVTLKGIAPNSGKTNPSSGKTNPTSGKPKPKGGSDVPVFGELDRELVTLLLNERIQVGIKTVGQDNVTMLSKNSTIPSIPFAITLVSISSKFVKPDLFRSGDIQQISKLLNLESLYVHGVEVPKSFWTDVTSVHSLTHLSIVEAGASDATIAALPTLPRLRTLDLSDSTVSNASLGRIASYPALESLAINRTRVTSGGFKLLAKSSLRILRAENLNLKDSDLAVLSGWGRLDELSLADESLTGEGFEGFNGRVPLKRLSLEGARLTETGAARIGELESLQSLTLRLVELDETRFKAVCGRSGIESFQLIDSTVPESALSHLTANSALRSLNFEGTKLTGAGFKGAAPLLDVKQMTLSKTSLDNAGLAHVARAFPNVTHLSLSETAVTDAGLKSLRSLRSLDSLAVDRTKVTAKGLAELASLTRLNTLVIPSTISPDDARAALPKCRNISATK